jgi:hypothetical protein
LKECACEREREREENEWRRLESIQRTVCDFVCCCEYLVSMLQSSVALVAVLQCIKLPVKCKMISSQILCRRIVAGISKNDPRLKRVEDTSPCSLQMSTVRYVNNEYKQIDNTTATSIFYLKRD